MAQGVVERKINELLVNMNQLCDQELEDVISSDGTNNECIRRIVAEKRTIKKIKLGIESLFVQLSR